MRQISERWTTGALFFLFLAAAAIAMAHAYMILGRLIIAAGDGISGPVAIIAAGALVGTLTAFVIHEISAVLPGVMRHLNPTVHD